MMTEEQITVLLEDLETVMAVGDRIEPDDIRHAITLLIISCVIDAKTFIWPSPTV